MTHKAQQIIDNAIAAGRHEASLPAGEYREKLYIDCGRLKLAGADAVTTIISWDDCANKHFPDGDKYGTFRSYSAFFRADRLDMSNLTIANTAGFGKEVGQAVAAYFDCREAVIERCRFLGRQDTIFTAPLPERPVIPNSFKGPNDGLERKPSLLYFRDCYIEGDVDFIFGGATAIFDNCELRSLSRPHNDESFVAAPSTDADVKYGYIFLNCRFTGDCPAGSTFIARPWRKDGACAVIDCEFGAHISPLGWDDWNGNEEKRRCARFSQSPAVPGRAEWSHSLTAEQREEHLAFVRQVRQRLGIN